MTKRRFRIKKKKYLELSSFEGDCYYYVVMVQVRILGIWWTLNRIKDISAEYATNRAIEILEYITTND